MHCRKAKCPKNHIEHYQVEDEDGNIISKEAKLHIVHHKNERKDGHIILQMPPSMVEVLDILEKASLHLAPDCPTIFCKTWAKVPFEEQYFSQYACSALTFDSKKRSTATGMRHEFVSKFRDFQSTRASTHKEQEELEEGAAMMMGNRPPSWNATYDDKVAMRPMEKVLAVYPAFKAWVLQEHEQASKRRKVARDPLA